ncbi:MAG: mevalonate kinase, partial [Woeseiaceae bacterium]
ASLIEFANELQPSLVARGGGVKDIEFLQHELDGGESLVVLHLHVDTRDAMGANAVNTLCEALGPKIERTAGGHVGLRILSNLADGSMVTARGHVPLNALAADAETARSIRDGIVRANRFALADPYRAATHNKGIMNGIDAVALATGNDWRAIEAGAHAYAAVKGRYRALTDWSVGEHGDLCGVLTLPIKPGIVGGSLQSNPGAALGLAICDAKTSTELAELMGAVGLAQNFAALRALVSSGIQRGHMRLHARSVAVSAGVPDEIFADVVNAMLASGEVKIRKAIELAKDYASRSEAQPLLNRDDAAAGKVILFGEHAVVYDRHALAIPIERAVAAVVEDGEQGVRLAIADWGIEQAWRAGDANLDGAAAVVDLILSELGCSHRDINITVNARIPLGVGLGSSAAFAVAVIRAVGEFLHKKLASGDVNELALKCEAITHGTPSGIDNHLATYAKPILFQKGIDSNPTVIQVNEALPLVVAAGHLRGNTKKMVSGVRERYAADKSLYTGIFDSIDEIAVAGAEALRESDYNRLGRLMNVCHGLLNAIGVSSPELESMVGIARSAGAIGAKLTGAGGGGSIIALCPGKIDVVSRALADAGYRIVRIGM